MPLGTRDTSGLMPDRMQARRSWIVAGALYLTTLGCGGGGGGTTARPAPHGTLVGSVRRQIDNAPVAGAAVSLRDIPRSTSAGTDGTFQLAGVPPGEHTVQVSAPGYATTSRALTVAAGTPLVADFALVDAPVGVQQVTFSAANQLWRIAARVGATPENLTPRLDAIATQPGRHFGPISVSSDGEWYVFHSERFDSANQGFPGLTIVPADFSRAETVRVGGNTIHGEGLAQATRGGDAIVYVDGNGPHARDLFVVRRAQTGWTGPTLLTGSSPHAFHDAPVLSADGARVIHQAGPVPYGGDGTRICEVRIDGTGFRDIVLATNVPPGFSACPAVRMAAPTPDGGLVFESEWAGSEQVWRLPASGGPAVRVGARFVNDNSPNVLPDGRIVSLWLNATNASGLHHLKVMDADGGNEFVLTLGQTFAEVDDVGVGCGVFVR